MINFLKINLNYVAKIGLKIAGTLFSLLTLLLTFISWDDIGITSRCDRLLIIFLLLHIRFILNRLILIGDTNSKKGFSRVSKCQLRGHVTGGLGSPVVSVNNPSNDYENAAYSLTQAT